MKKFIGLILVGLLVLAFGTTVFAQAKLDFRASGFLQAVSVWDENVPPINGNAQIYGANANYNTPNAKAYDKTTSYLDYRAHLKFDAVMGKELSGTIYFEIDSARWGDSPGGFGNKFRDAGTMGQWRSDSGSVEVKHIYLDVALPYFGIPVPMTLRVGQQPFAIRNKVFLTNDGMGIMAGLKLDPVMISPFYGKMVEGVDWNADDDDMYGLHVNAKLGTFTVGGYGLYYNMNTYPMFVTIPVSGGTGSTLSIPTAVQGTQTADFWWVGAYADGKAGPIDLQLDFVYDSGKVKSRLSNVRDVTYSGWVGKVAADYPFEQFNFGGAFAWASGANKKKTDANGYANGTNSRVDSFVVPPSSENAPSSYESIMLSMNASSSGGIGWANGTTTNQVCRGLLGGIWFAKLYGSYKVTPWYKVVLQGLYIGDTTDNGDTFGTSVNSNGTLKDGSTVGWELDLINYINIYKNLVWDIGLGVLSPGDALKFKNVGSNTNDKPSTPWAVTTRFTYSF